MGADTTVQLIDLTALPPDIMQRADVIVAACRPALGGEHPLAQGFALADLVAMWLAGHQLAPGEHEALLAMHVEAVRSLLPLAKDRIDERLRAAGGTA
jgi:hypothetical protein